MTIGIVQLALACALMYALPGEAAKKTLLIYVVEFPLWALMTNLNMPKRNEENRDIWSSKFFFTVFLGFGLSIVFFVIGMIGLTFLVAISGADIEVLYRYLFPAFHGAALFLAFIYHQREISRLQSWGLDYRERMTLEAPSPDEDTTTQGIGETLAMLTILDLEPDLTMEDLKLRYRELSKLYHPDRLSSMSEKERETAEKEFKRIQRAYEIVKSQIEKGRL
tara:strand:- start:373 stop:1038 length:666 start_codon:yes stop_codon:yes gene_type:complete